MRNITEAIKNNEKINYDEFNDAVFEIRCDVEADFVPRRVVLIRSILGGKSTPEGWDVVGNAALRELMQDAFAGRYGTTLWAI